jgi:hypothetical protein
VPRVKPPKLTSPSARRDIADGAAELNYAPALAALGIADGDRRWGEARAMLQQVAANYLVVDAVAGTVKAGNARKGVKAGNARKGGARPGVEETPAGQIATLKVALQLLKVQAKQGYPNPFFPHPCDDKEDRHRGALPMALEMAIATELRAIELTADPEMSADVKLVAAIDAAIDRLKGAMSTGRRHNSALDNMIDQLEAVAFDLAPAVVASRKRLWEFIGAFMVDAMAMKRPDIESNRSRADKLLPEGRADQRQKMLKTEQAQADAARRREIDKQNEQTLKLLRKLQGRGA